MRRLLHHPTGDRNLVTITHEDALTFAKETAQAFGVGESKTVPFDKDRAKKDVAGEGDAKRKGKKGKKSAPKSAPADTTAEPTGDA